MMVSKGPEDTKLIFLPEELVDKMKNLALRKGISLSAYATEAIEQALRVEKMQGSVKEAVDIFHYYQVSKSSGTIQIPRLKFNEMLENSNLEKSGNSWFKAGKWYGEYLKTRLNDEALPFFKEDLILSWNLDEVELKYDDLYAELSLISFTITEELTKLLLNYITGVMESFDFKKTNQESLRGLANMKFTKNIDD